MKRIRIAPLALGLALAAALLLSGCTDGNVGDAPGGHVTEKPGAQESSPIEEILPTDGPLESILPSASHDSGQADDKADSNR